MEILDIVDQSDRVIGQSSRDRIHAEGMIHRATHMLVYDSRDRLFIQQRSFQKDNDPGLWDSSAAGHVDAGETYLDCAVRELREELGLNLMPGDLKQLFKLPPRPETGMEFAMVYSVCTDQAMTLDPDEVIGGKWLTANEIDDWVQSKPNDLSQAFSIIWKTMKQEPSG